MPGGLRLLSAVGSLQDRRGALRTGSARRADRGRAGTRRHRARRASAWARRGATSRTAPRSTRSSTWSGSCADLGMEACCTLGMLTQDQADALAAAGLTAYNHNLDTSPEFYGSIITTRTYDERLETLARVRKAGVTVCCGGIIGMGEDRRVRYRLLQQLASLAPHPESVPVNMLVRVEGTPLADRRARGSVRAGAHDRDRAHPDARFHRPLERRPSVAHRRGAGAVLPGRRQFGLPRRTPADHAESRRRRTTSSCWTGWACG